MKFAHDEPVVRSALAGEPWSRVALLLRKRASSEGACHDRGVRLGLNDETPARSL